MKVFETLIQQIDKTYNENVTGFYVRAAEFKNEMIKLIREAEKEYKKQNTGWIPIDVKCPDNDTYVLISFANFSIPDIGRYEEDENGGAFYPGDDDESYAHHGIIPNAWRPLPEKYHGNGLPTNADKIRSLTDSQLVEVMLGDIDACEKIPFCKRNPLCEEALDSGELIPKSKCKECLMKWLRSEVDYEDENSDV